MDETALRVLVGQLNWIDWIVVLVVLLAAVGGLRDGFVAGTVQLLGSLLALGVAIVGLAPAEAVVGDYVHLPKPVATILAFLALLVVTRLAWKLVGMGLNAPRMAPPAGFGAVVSRVAGLIPGLLHGLMVAALAVLLFAVFPILPEATQAIDRSVVASRLVAFVADRAPAGALALQRRGS